jgi:hypothetical protein
LRPELLAGGLHQYPAISVQCKKLSLNTIQNLDRTERGEEEAKRFWPIYDAYNTELGNVVDARYALLKAYADDYDKMTDAKATELLTRRFSIQKQRALLDEKYRKQFATALSPRRLARFYQIEHEFDLLLELQVVSQTPKMKWW